MSFSVKGFKLGTIPHSVELFYVPKCTIKNTSENTVALNPTVSPAIDQSIQYDSYNIIILPLLLLWPLNSALSKTNIL